MPRRARRHTPTVSVTTSCEDEEGNEVSIDCECHVTPGSRDYYDRNYGWQPGDAPECELLSARGEDGADWTERITADRDWLASVEAEALEAFGAPGDDDAAYEAEWRGER